MSAVEQWQETLETWKNKAKGWGPWVVQSVEHPILGFGSSRDLRLVTAGPMTDGLCAQHGDCLRFSLLLPLLLLLSPRSLSLSLCLSQREKECK